ncbi:MAG TPA: patatin-like phospholipase family protein [Fulvivirga sp.]|nr:patatin-like phospholipase family protein [Fulvivirga sp.]
MSPLLGQKVALVMSGGGAKGLAHIGVIKALEENNIPIDYVVGTSMGGIVAGCYAAGYSAKQIEGIMLSDQFQRWVNGEFEKGYNYYLHQDKPNSSFISINLSLDSIFNATLNSSLASDLTLNFALVEYLSSASAIANNNFDSLYVPTRVVAADIFTQNIIVLKNASLPLAVRTTLSVPFFYKPIKIDNKYLFDGGIYNNFPVDIAQKEFEPDVIIGSNVSSKVFNKYPYENDDKLINNSLLFMLVDKSDPSSIPDSGVYIEPNLSGFTSFDFSKAKSLIDSGYAATMASMDEIKAKIKTRQSDQELRQNRKKFTDRAQPMQFSNIEFHGYNSRQRKYIKKIFHFKEGQTLTLDDIKRGYFKFVSENYFKTIYPDIQFNKESGLYALHLYGRPRNNLNFDLGGVIASRNISQIYLGAKFYYFDNYLLKNSINFYSGSFYKSAQFKSRLNLSGFSQFYIEPELTYNNWDYINSNEFLLDSGIPTILDRIDRKYGLNIGLPLGNKFRTILSGAFINNTDEYVNNQGVTTLDTLDILDLKGYRAGISFGRNSFNRKQYPSDGKGLKVSLDYFSIDEDYTPGNTSSINPLKRNHEWFRAAIRWEQFFKKGRWSTGYSFDGVYTEQDFFANYKGTLINLPAFNPLQDSRTLLLQNFRAFSFASAGLKNILKLRQNLDFRIEGYVFTPFETLEIENDVLVRRSKFDKAYFAGSSGLVMHSPIGPISFNLNYYDDPENKWGLLLHFGFMLYNDSSMER